MKKYIILFLLVAIVGACNEDEFLKETPLDFMSGNNAYSTEADFNLASNELYYLVRQGLYNSEDRPMDFLYGTDLVRVGGTTSLSNLSADYDPTGNIAREHWNAMYLLVAQSNVIISRLSQSNVAADKKILFEATAKFFRGFAYRTLAYLYGGVPLQLEEVTKPKSDYVRATREETLLQAIEDVKFAAENLKDLVDVKDGEVNAAAAYHLLAELYLAAGQNQNAVDAATIVIDNPATALMQVRFGSRVTQPGDVYWDLFRTNNQNRKSGNTEGLWVIQLEANVVGGGAMSGQQRWDRTSYILERHCAPLVRDFKILYDHDNNPATDVIELAPFIWETGDYTGGRGIGTAVATDHFHNEVWVSDFDNDMRNSNYNFVRKFAFNNPAFKTAYGAIFGDTIDITNPPTGITGVEGFITNLNIRGGGFPGRNLMGYQTKCTMPFNHPASLYRNASTYLLQGTAGGTYVDQYMFRLAETYLLRAEAYLNLNNKASAALDINVVRSRAHASDVLAADVDIDYILDERMRELGIEEKRRMTLGRLGTAIFYDRVTRYNPFYTTSADGQGFLEKYTLWPIPHSTIEANKDAELEQNPGY